MEHSLHFGVSSMQTAKIILLADDEPIVRKFAATVLCRAGYTVVEAHSTPDALKAADGRPVDLLITDVGMEAGPSGIELAAALETGRPGLKVILMSGIYDESVRAFGWHFLQKPFDPAALVSKVNLVLSASGAAESSSP
jgi:DNA-binding NtrC family response regulator